MNHQKGFIHVLIIIIGILLVLVALGFFAYKNPEKKVDDIKDFQKEVAPKGLLGQ